LFVELPQCLLFMDGVIVDKSHLLPIGLRLDRVGDDSTAIESRLLLIGFENSVESEMTRTSL